MNYSNIKLSLIMMASIVFCANIKASPFSECPTEAFLVQDTTARLYGVRLATGYYNLLSDNMGTNNKLNAIGFNFHDNYLYAWSYEFQSPVKIDSNYQVIPLNAANLPNTSFYVGDVAVNENKYYFYRSGASYGLYYISLDSNDPDYLNTINVIDGSQLNLAIYDMAFHPNNGRAYSVSRNGALYSINVTTGTAQLISNVGQTGTFGAVYFDVNETLYISRNSDGYVFRINTNEVTPTAEFFAYGPSSNNNDGARCALAPVTNTDIATIDFGSAPDSYGTSMDNNGARHEVSNNIFLGESVDTEVDAYIFPLSDAITDQQDDVDGIHFVSGIEVGYNTIIQVKSSSPAYLNAWCDWNQNGQFDADEKIIDDELLTTGQNSLLFNVPVWANAGSTWARFRLSTDSGIGPTGGVGDGEVEDYQIDVIPAETSIAYYPSSTGHATIAFEDNWPLMGDYDMNDLVLYFNTAISSVAGHVVNLKISGEVAAVGAAYHNGLAFRIPGVLANEVDANNIQFIINNRTPQTALIANNRNDLTLIITDDVWQYVSVGENCKFYRTEKGCGSNIQMEFSLNISFKNGVNASRFPKSPFDPYIFATPAYYHGYLLGQAPGQSLEIHLMDQQPTEIFNINFLGRGDDNSLLYNNHYFVNNNGMPWALHIGTEWQYPLEYIDIIKAYPNFINFVTTSGQESTDWYIESNSITNHIFKN